MSMNLKLLRVSDNDISKLRARPEGVKGFIKAGEPIVTRPPGYAKAREDMARQMGLPVEEEPVMLDFDTYSFREVFNAQKMWQGVHYLLTGSDYVGEPPASWLLNSPPVGDDLGYGPAMTITAGNTKILSNYLDGLDRKMVLDRFDGAEMMGLNLYPNIWDEDEAELKAELGDAFDKLRVYCRRCTEHELGMLSYIT